MNVLAACCPGIAICPKRKVPWEFTELSIMMMPHCFGSVDTVSTFYTRLHPQCNISNGLFVARLLERKPLESAKCVASLRAMATQICPWEFTYNSI